MPDFIPGQKTKLSDLTPSQTLLVKLETRGSAVPDAACFALDADGQLEDDRYFIFYNQPASPEGAIRASFSSGGGQFEVQLVRLPGTLERLVFALTLDAATLSGVVEGALTLEAQARPVARYPFRGPEFGALQAVMVAELYKRGGEWRFAAVGQGFNGGLKALLEHFGGQALEEAPSAAQTSNVEGSGAAPTPTPSSAAVPPTPHSPLPTIHAPPSSGHGSPVRLSSVNGRTSGEFRSWLEPTLSNLPGVGRPSGRSWLTPTRTNFSDGGSSVTASGYRRADEVDYRIYGDDMQIVEVELDPGETVRAEAGAMMYMREGIEMQTSTDAGSRGGGLLGGLMSGLTRVMAGESFFITTFTHKGQGKSHVAFAAPYPGKIIPLDLREVGGTFLCQRDAFLCGAKGVDVNIAFTKRLGAGFFGGEGFILQRLSGDGLAFIHAGGAIIERTLAPGETVRVDTGCVVGFAESVQYDIQMVGGFKNALFGGEGLFLATLRGPGLVYLQSLPLSRLADRIRTALPGNRG